MSILEFNYSKGVGATTAKVVFKVITGITKQILRKRTSWSCWSILRKEVIYICRSLAIQGFIGNQKNLDFVNPPFDRKAMQFNEEWSYLIVLVELIHNSGRTV